MLIAHCELTNDKSISQPKQSSLCWSVRAFYLEINAILLFDIAKVYPLVQPGNTLYVFLEIYNFGKRYRTAACSKLLLLACVTNTRFECSRLHSRTRIHMHIYTHTHTHTHTHTLLLSLQMHITRISVVSAFQCRLHSWCLGRRYSSAEGIRKQKRIVDSVTQ